jgi:hypothetical protein
MILMENYSNDNDMYVFGMLVNALGNNNGGDYGSSFPKSDADDFGKGARFVPGEVTLARRRGEFVEFVQNCNNSLCWYWRMSNGDKIYHFESWIFESLLNNYGLKRLSYNATENEKKEWAKKLEELDVKCPHCGNKNIRGGTIKRS